MNACNLWTATVVVAALVTATLGASCASPERKAANLEAELDDITRWWSGRFAGQAFVPGTADDAEMSVFHEIVSIQAPQFGARVFSYQLRRDSVDGPILQQKIFSFDTNAARESNFMRAWIFLPEQQVPELATTPEAWRSLQPDRLTSFPDTCAFRWQKTKAGFAGAVSSVDCAFESTVFGQQVRSDMSYEIEAQALTWSETLTGANGAVVASTNGALRADRLGPIIDVRRSYYDVEGATVAEIRRDLYAESPIFADGESRAARTDWVVSWDVERSESDSGCRIERVATIVELTYLLPRLVDHDTVADELRAEWDAYIVALLEHELRHQQFAVDAAHKIESVLPALREREDCESLAAEAGRTASGIVDSARRRERQYDYTTRHGQAEGAEFPRSEDW